MTRNQRRPEQEKEIKLMKNQDIMFTAIIPRTSKARLVRSALAVGIFALILQVSLSRAQAFDLSSLNGNYADSYQVLGPANTIECPADKHLFAIFNGGLVDVQWRRRLRGGTVFNVGGGVILNPDFLPTVTGAQTVNANGTGTMNWTGGGLPRQRHFVICDGGNQLKYIASSTTEGHLYSGTMVKQ